MKQWITIKLATYTLLSFFLLAIVFHITVLVGITPYDLTWGGRLENESQMRVFELVSIIISIVILLVVGMKGGLIKSILPVRLINAILWLLVIMFSLNTIGNLFAQNNLETLVATPITLISAVMCFRMAIE